MNKPPETDRRLSFDQIRDFVLRSARAAGLPADRAELLAEFLAGNDLRGNFSHGSAQIATYARLMRAGTLNPEPEVSVVKETPVSALVDGDGGLGYFPAHDGTKIVIEKALVSGIAVLLTRNHGHFGAAGLYARMAVDAGLCAFVTSGHQLNLKAGSSHYAAAGGSPMAFGAPGGKEPPVILDFGAMHDLYAGNPERDELARMAPGLVLRSIGQGVICQIWGGFLSGLTSDPADRRWDRDGANQGALVICFQPDLFIEPDELRDAVDEYAETVRALTPLPGLDGAYLPGHIEEERMKAFTEAGIPVSDEHKKLIDELAQEIGIEPLRE